jgi:UDP-N-acetylmuramate--alanine ligase
MHIFFSGIGGGGIGPLARIARQAGHDVSGSDKQESTYTKQLQKEGVELYIGQTEEQIAALHARHPIDWLVYSSALTRENSQHPELLFAKRLHIKHSLRDELLNQIIADKHLGLIGIAGTHGKSTTTAMVIWLFHKLTMPIGYSVGAKLPFGPMGQLADDSRYFVYECDEFDYNFLSFHPKLALITGISWDHHEIFPTRDSYQKAFRDFIGQSKHTFIWQKDLEHIQLQSADNLTVLNENDATIATIALPGLFNRQDAYLAIMGVHRATKVPVDTLIDYVQQFPGLKQRMEQLAPNLYSNYAHTPEKIRGGMSTALEIAKAHNQELVIIYEPLTNRRQHHIKHDYKDSFAGAKKIHWVRTYLAREDPDLPLLEPEELIKHLDDPSLAQPAKMDDGLLATIREHIKAGDMVVAMGASGGGSLDEWLRTNIDQLQV